MSAPSRENVVRFARQAYSKATIIYLAIGLALLAIVIAGGQEFLRHVNAIESGITELGPWGVVAFVALFVTATSLLVPDTVVCIIAGALFGLGLGFAACCAGIAIASMFQYALASRIFRTKIQRALMSQPALNTIQRAVANNQLRLQFLLRLAPLNPATISYLLGAAGVRFSGFLLALPLLTPHLFFEVYVGHAGIRAARLASSDLQFHYTQYLPLIGGLAACLVLLWYLSNTARKALMQSVAENEPKPTTVACNSE